MSIYGSLRYNLIQIYKEVLEMLDWILRLMLSFMLAKLTFHCADKNSSFECENIKIRYMAMKFLLLNI